MNSIRPTQETPRGTRLTISSDEKMEERALVELIALTVREVTGKMEYRRQFHRHT